MNIQTMMSEKTGTIIITNDKNDTIIITAYNNNDVYISTSNNVYILEAKKVISDITNKGVDI